MNGKILCYFNFNLLFDINSVFLAFIKLKDPSADTQSINYQRNPFSHVEQFQNQILPYLQTVKPQIGALETLHFLQNQGIHYQIFSTLPMQFIEILNLNLNLSINRVQVFDGIVFDSDENLTNRIIIKNHSFKNKTFWEQCSIPMLYDSLLKVDWMRIIGIDSKVIFPQPQFHVSLENPSLDMSIKYWNKAFEIDPIHIVSKVIYGFGRGGRQLGIPTANLEINEEIGQKVQDLLSGVYIGNLRMRNNKYGGVLSIGYNPYYNNTKRSLEVHVFGTFDEDFYGEEIDLVISSFIRVESDFKEFDYLIRFINNDVYLAKKKYSTQNII